MSIIDSMPLANPPLSARLPFSFLGFYIMDFKEWGAHIQRAIPNYGQTMSQSARVAFEGGHIERRWYLMLASSVSSGS